MGLYLYKNQDRETLKTTHVAHADPILPASEKATLSLSDGEKINLSAVQHGQLAMQEGAQITKTSMGEVVYTPTKNQSAFEKYNKIETPRAGIYKLRLPDGTNVWLNAASTLRYPTTFTSLKERRVELSGEAYFEVAKNKALPFRVATGNQVLEVLGTHFNLNAYHEEGLIKTTLLEGRLQINKTILRPGEQAINNGLGLKVTRVDPETAIDWRKGTFIFTEGDSFINAMRKIERWYNVEFVYSDPTILEIEPRAHLFRTKNISELLNIIGSSMHIHFKIDGRRITVTK